MKLSCTTTVRSPLTGQENVREVRRILATKIVEAWKKQFEIDLSQEFTRIDAVVEYRCEETGLLFFSPREVAGSGELYARLAKFDWYYMPEKWEHRHALRIVPSGRRLLEVGCGRGDFLTAAKAGGWKQAEGLEINSSAADAGCALGHMIHMVDVSTHAEHNPSSYDLVCCFQVLEHIADPLSFLAACVEMVRPHGYLFIAVPNADSFLGGLNTNILDAPPHHMTRWGKQALNSLDGLFDLDVVSVKDEPLTKYHRDWYLNNWTPRGGRVAEALWKRIGRRSAKRALRMIPQLHKLISGHTHAACYRKR